jgi:4-diphosphocytidyl-2C-methyl-D-erythritol kinase
MSGDELVGRANELRDANDLWPAAVALAPELRPLRDVLEDRLGRPALLSGSGATLFCLYPSIEHALAAGRFLMEDPGSRLASARVAACDLAGPDPAWRFP